MRFITPIVIAAAAFGLAGTAQAQSHDSLEYRVLAANSASATLVATNVTGPQSARRLTNIMMAGEPGPSGADNFVSDVVVNCQTSEIEYLKSVVYTGGEVLADLPGNGEKRVPKAGSMDEAVVAYACKGALSNGETPKVRGLAAAREQGRKAMAEE